MPQLGFCSLGFGVSGPGFSGFKVGFSLDLRLLKYWATGLHCIVTWSGLFGG